MQQALIPHHSFVLCLSASRYNLSTGLSMFPGRICCPSVRVIRESIAASTSRPMRWARSLSASSPREPPSTVMVIGALITVPPGALPFRGITVSPRCRIAGNSSGASPLCSRGAFLNVPAGTMRGTPSRPTTPPLWNMLPMVPSRLPENAGANCPPMPPPPSVAIWISPAWPPPPAGRAGTGCHSLKGRLPVPRFVPAVSSGTRNPAGPSSAPAPASSVRRDRGRPCSPVPPRARRRRAAGW